MAGETPRVVAVVDDDATTRRILRHWLSQEGFEVAEHADAQSALGEDPKRLAAACVDLQLGETSGLELVKHLLSRDPGLPIVIVTASQDVESAVVALRSGAYDYVVKPLERERVVGAVERASERRSLELNVRRLEAELRGSRALGSLVGSSPAMRQLAEQVSRVLESDVPVSVFGESGTGKELVARAIHASGHRFDGPFVAVNCAAIPPSLQESELFGHERGAFTGAVAMRRGALEQADGGTLFLDEIGEMGAATQAALLRALEEHIVRRVGGSVDVPIDARIVCATHRDLAELVAQGRFREDLYFRLVVFPIRVPALRERTSDIPELVAHFLHLLRADTRRSVEHVSADALDALVRHPWPGNVRELRNVVHRALLCCDGAQLELAHLPPELRQAALPSLVAAPGAPAAVPETFDLKTVERRTIERAIAHAQGNIAEAARLLGVGRATIYRKLASFDDGGDLG